MSFLRDTVKMMSTTRPLGDYFNCCHENSREIYKVYLDYLFASTVESRFFEPSVLRASWSYWNQVFSWALSNQISLGEACRKRYKTPAIAQSNVALSILYDISVTEYVPDFRRFSVWPRSSQNCFEVHSRVPMKLLFASMLLLKTKLQFDSVY